MLIKDLFYYTDSRIWDLQQWDDQGTIIGEPKKVALGIFEFLDLDWLKNINVERQKILAWDLRNGSNWVLLEILVHDLMSHTQLNPWIIKDFKIAAVNHTAFVSLINGVVKAQDICTKKGIIALNNQS